MSGKDIINVTISKWRFRIIYWKSESWVAYHCGYVGPNKWQWGLQVGRIEFRRSIV